MGQQAGAEKEDQAKRQRGGLPGPFEARRPPPQNDRGGDDDVSRRGKHEGEWRREEPGNEQGEEGGAQNGVAPTASRAPAGEKHRSRRVQRGGQMGKIRSEPIPVVDLEDAAKGRKQEIERKLRAGRAHEPGKTDAAPQENDRNCDPPTVNGVANDSL